MKPDLDKLEAEVNAATPGPWEWDSRDNMVAGFYKDSIIETDSGVYGPEEQDRVFIASAREAVPALIAELRAAREVVLKAAMFGYGGCGCSIRPSHQPCGLHEALNHYSRVVRGKL